MKIALAHYSAKEDISGVTSWFERFILRLHKDGFDICVYLHHFGNQINEASILQGLKDAGIDVEVVPRLQSLDLDVSQTLNFLNRKLPTLFLPQCLNSHYFAAAIAGKQGLPWVLTMHSDDPDYWAIATERPPLSNGGKTVSVSKHIASLLKTQGIDTDSTIIPYGVEIPVKFSSYSNKPFLVVYVGRMIETQKRLSLVTEALINACNLDHNINGLLIGDGPSLAENRQLVLNSGLRDRIIFTGRLTPEQTRAKILNAQSIILMSDFEGLPVSLLEAMAVGLVPVVRFIESGIPELVHHEKTGLLVDDQPLNASKAILRLANDQVLWQKCSIAARKLIQEHYSEDVCYYHWLKVIEQLNSQSKVNYPLIFPKHLQIPFNNPLLGAGYPKQKTWLFIVISFLTRRIKYLLNVLGIIPKQKL